MKLSEYSKYDGLGLAGLVAASRQVSATELAETALAAVTAINPEVNAVVEIYPDRVETLDEKDAWHGAVSAGCLF